MRTHRDDRPDFEDFVAVCSGRLLRTAYLLTRDADLAERLLERALGQAWFGWNHLDDQPELEVRATLVNTYDTWWRRRWDRRRPAAGRTDSWDTLPRHQRVVLVLRYFDDLSAEDAADLLEVPVGTVRHRATAALRRLDLTEDRLRAALAERADGVGEGIGPRARADAVEARVARAHLRRRTWVGTAVGLASAAVVVGAAVVPPLLPQAPAPGPGPLEPMVQTPPRLAGWAMPEKVHTQGRVYRFARGEQSREPRGLLRVAVPSSRDLKVIAWSTTPGTPGRVVVSVDGTVVSNSGAGVFEYPVVLAAGRPHLVVVRPTAARSGDRIGLAIYEPDRGF
ncbi:sigma factor-like helix-turn-helix DNA-binding protein [Nocardioides panacis]|uniref:sigma factor-like helix-turn-helix DNA-binding protein n=1 Tax=Nocardioides panacis TaxID=2849501 RepID=UPI0020B20317|nr:sigma factor-like helix-turn-helix DNA-binding protein [Nocardioides panacis]